MVTIEGLLSMAREKGASDLHIAAGAVPKMRVNGELTDMGFPKLLPGDAKNIILSILSERNRAKLENTGEICFSGSMPGLGRYRASVSRQGGPYALAMRIIGTNIPSATELGLPESVVGLTGKKRGLVLVTGPAGSGKSTTLASLLDIINTNCNSHIITLEDPVEYLHGHKKSIVNQREAGIGSISYSQALRAALREDPDVILVGEMCGLDTVSAAITAAEAGCLVFSSMNTTGAANTIDRIINAFPPHQQAQARTRLAQVLEAVISQQLVAVRDGGGRAAVFEVMHATAAIKGLVREAKTHQVDSIIQANKKMGMQAMDDAIYEMYLKGKIGVQEALASAIDPFALERRLF